MIEISKEELKELLLIAKYWGFQQKEDPYYGIMGLNHYMADLLGTDFDWVDGYQGNLAEDLEKFKDILLEEYLNKGRDN